MSFQQQLFPLAFPQKIVAVVGNNKPAIVFIK